MPPSSTGNLSSLTRNAQIAAGTAPRALAAPELLGEVARVGQRVQRVAGDDEVGAGPDDRADRGERGVAATRSRPASPASATHSQYRPAISHASGRSSAGDAEQERRPAVPRRGAARLEHRRPDDERHVGDVDVAARGVEREVEARADQRAGDEADERRERLARRAGRRRRRARRTRATHSSDPHALGRRGRAARDARRRASPAGAASARGRPRRSAARRRAARAPQSSE